MHDMAMKVLIQKAYEHANSITKSENDLQHLHSARSRNFVEGLADLFRDVYKKPDYYVFSKFHDENRTEFKLNELGFDIHVCEIARTPTVDHENVAYVKRSVWQIESEFAEDGREALIDFSKLVGGAAAQKLFIGPQLTTNSRFEKFRDSLLAPARECSGAVYAAFIPHPRLWGEPECDKAAHLYRVGPNGWDEI